MGTVFANKDTKCAFCKRPIFKGDEIGFDTIRNKNREPADRFVVICISCYDRKMEQESKVKYDD